MPGQWAYRGRVGSAGWQCAWGCGGSSFTACMQRCVPIHIHIGRGHLMGMSLPLSPLGSPCLWASKTHHGPGILISPDLLSTPHVPFLHRGTQARYLEAVSDSFCPLSLISMSRPSARPVPQPPKRSESTTFILWPHSGPGFHVSLPDAVPALAWPLATSTPNTDNSCSPWQTWGCLTNID